jgi:hypothetical protein
VAGVSRTITQVCCVRTVMVAEVEVVLTSPEVVVLLASGADEMIRGWRGAGEFDKWRRRQANQNEVGRAPKRWSDEPHTDEAPFGVTDRFWPE